MMYSCNDIRERLSEFIDDMLSPEEKTDFEKHISTCDDCKAELEALKCVIREVKKLPAAPLPDGFKQQLHKRLVEESKPKVYKLFNSNWKAYSSVAAGIILVLLLRTGYHNLVIDYDTAYINDKTLTMIEETDDITPQPKVEDEAAKITSDDEVQTAESTPTPSQSRNIAVASNRTSIKEDLSNNAQESEGASEAETSPAPSDTASTEEDFIEGSNEVTEPVQESTTDNLRLFSYDTSVSTSKEDEPQPSADTKSVAPRSGGGGESTKSYGSDNNADTQINASEVMPSADTEYSFARIHDYEQPEYVSVKVAVDNFSVVAHYLSTKYKSDVKNEQLTLSLDHEDFDYVMNYLVAYGAIVTQDDTATNLNLNSCIIVAK